MKELHGQATGTTAAPLERSLKFLRAVDDYPRWYPDVVREVDVVERDGHGQPTKARATLHVSVGPLNRDVHVTLAVTTDEPATVSLTRVPNEPGDEEALAITWHLEHESETRIRLHLDANLSVPRLVPLGGVGDSIAQGFVGAAVKALGRS